MEPRRLVAWTLGLLLLAGVAAAQVYIIPFNPPPSGGGGAGTDFTADSACEGAWIIADTSADATIDNECDGASDADMTNEDSTPTYTTREGLEFLLFAGGDTASVGDASDASLDSPTTAATIGCFIRPASDQKQTGLLDMGTNQLALEFSFESPTPQPFLIRHQAGSNTVIGTTDSTIDTISHAVGTWDTSDDVLEVWFDAASEATTTSVTTALSGDSGESCLGDSLQSGASCTDSFYQIDGELSHCAYFSRRLTDPEICDWCRFGLEGTVSDRSSSCNTCTGTGD